MTTANTKSAKHTDRNPCVAYQRQQDQNATTCTLARSPLPLVLATSRLDLARLTGCPALTLGVEANSIEHLVLRQAIDHQFHRRVQAFELAGT